MQAIILAGGFGTRLQSVISEVPKPMAPIYNKPFLHWLILHLKKNGFTSAILSIHYLKEKIVDYFGNKFAGIDIKYAIEDEPLGTGGAILNSLQHINEENFFILNGDSFLDLNYPELYQEHKNKNSNLTITLCKIKDTARYGRVEIDPNRIISFQEKGIGGEGYINAGIYLIKKDWLNQCEFPKKFSIETDFFYKKTQEIKPNYFLSKKYFIDIGIPEDYKKSQTEIPKIISYQDE